MQIGMQMVFQSWGYGGISDSQVMAEDIELGILADQLGFDGLWPVEHHFSDYSFCPDNIVLLSFMAARTKQIKLATGAVILPWNNPLRVVEKLAMLDNLSDGRLLFGMGRGLSRSEYEHFGIPMEESRERFDEAARMIVDALETGYIKGDGPYYPQPRTEIRPRIERSFSDRKYCVAMSPDSVDAAADLGARMTFFSQKPIEQQVASVNTYRERFRSVHGREPEPPMISDFVYCDKDRGRAEEVAHTNITGYLASVMEHYELDSDHLKELRGYESYGNAVDMMKAIGQEKLATMYLDVNAWGTPDDIIERVRARAEVIGEYDLTCCFRFAGLPIEMATSSMSLFATAVMPVLKGSL
jgi:alkanesulfonate monooxygenase SsuD/methylene tetrahydromethanopterin reductase-like flavin-dependent oxidoreductase (luciferase family)